MGSSGGDGGAGAAQQSALQNQQNINQNILGQANGISSANSRYYQAPLAGEAQGYGNAVNGIAPQIGANYSSLMSSRGDMSGQTGVNENKLGQNLTDYASNPNASALSGIHPDIMKFFMNQMQQGINPQVAQNAQSQVSQGAAQQMMDARAHMAPGQNMNALQQSIGNKQLESSANLAGNIAGQSQTFMNQGAEGAQKQASGLDSQHLDFLKQALSGGRDVNNDAITNFLNSIQQGQSGLNNATSFTGQGQSGLGDAMRSEAGIASQAGDSAAKFGEQAAAARRNSGSMFGSLLGLGASAMTGGAAGAGGLGAILGKL
jgi:hypothetical protein